MSGDTKPWRLFVARAPYESVDEMVAQIESEASIAVLEGARTNYRPID